MLPEGMDTRFIVRPGRKWREGLAGGDVRHGTTHPGLPSNQGHQIIPDNGLVISHVREVVKGGVQVSTVKNVSGTW